MRQKAGLKLQCALQYDSSGVKAARAMALNGSGIHMMAEGNWPTRIQQLTLLSAAALALSTVPSIAGACSQGIDQMQAQINARLMAPDNTGRVAPESSAATMHAQPAPDMEEERLGDAAMAAAEAELGEVSSRAVQTVAAAMARARAADLAGDQSGCKHALADAQRALGH